MKLYIRCVALICFLLSGCSAASPASNVNPAPAIQPTASHAQEAGKIWRMVGYFPSWAPSTRMYMPADIPADLLTHLNYAFVVPDGQGFCVPDNELTADDNIAGLKMLKQVRPALQMLISIGGGGDLEKQFKKVVESPEAMAQFTTSCLVLMKRWGFDGLDMDWEFTQPEYKEPFTALMSEMRRQIDEQGRKDGRTYLLTMAAPAGPWGMARLELDKIQPLVDWINLMTYDYYGSWSTATGFLAPLYTSPGDPQGLSVDKTVHAYLDAGVPPGKLVLGVPFYGAAWQGVGQANNGLFQPNGGIFNQGAMDYREIAANYAGSFTLYRQEKSLAPWLYDSQQGVMITYDDPQSLKEKTAYAQKLGLGGMMIWQLAGDDLKNSLLKSLIK